VTSRLDRRLRELRARVLARSFEYRQRHLARGVWFRLRRVLTFASEAYALTREDGERLLVEGHRPESVGLELQPPRIIVYVPRARVAALPSARRLPVRLSADLLAVECLALVPFEEDQRGVPTAGQGQRSTPPAGPAARPPKQSGEGPREGRRAGSGGRTHPVHDMRQDAGDWAAALRVPRSAPQVRRARRSGAGEGPREGRRAGVRGDAVTRCMT
jgi:hypothetical protein